MLEVAGSDNLVGARDRRRDKMHQLQQTVQPYIIKVKGEVGASYYVIVDDFMLKFENFLFAVDVCFKVIHATNARYPTESESVWLVIQRALYGIRTPYDRFTSGVKNFLSNIGESSSI